MDIYLRCNGRTVGRIRWRGLRSTRWPGYSSAIPEPPLDILGRRRVRSSRGKEVWCTTDLYNNTYTGMVRCVYN